MGIYAKLIADRRLVKELKGSAGRDDVPAEEVEKLVAVVNEAADVAGPLLERIPATFKQYTEHNILHCRNLIDLMGRFIPRETLGQMNALELSVLILSALLHDFGMFASEGEKREMLKSPDFDSFLSGHHDRATALEEARRKGDHARAEVIRDALLAEYLRRMHPERARQHVRGALPGKLVYGGVDISGYVLDVCESHAWGVRESNDPRYAGKAVSRLSTNKAVYGVPLNLQYAACCLRLADIMDFDRSRTPVVVFQNVDFTEAKSWEEWNKHLSVKGWVISESDVLFRAECKHPAFYVAVMEFLDWVDGELGECRRLVVKEAPRDIAERYRLHLPPVVDRSEVEMEDKSYLAGGFRFQLEYERIMKLLMDRSLYPDPSLFLRELLQNSLDACRNREAHARDAGREGLYTPRISVWDHSDDAAAPRVVFQDNGVGMSRKIVENYFMRVGRSYYRSPEFDAERARLKKRGVELEATSQFGIGILSCFMVADRFEVETYRAGHQPLHITIEGPTKYFTIKLLPEPPRADFQPPPATDLEDGPPLRPGTRITIHLRPGAEVEVGQTLRTFAVNVDYDIAVHGAGGRDPHVIPRFGWDSLNPATLLQPWVTPSPFSSQYLYKEELALPAEALLSNLMEVLEPSRIPFEKYEFSRHLRGHAWFWLLKGEHGRASVSRGYLDLSKNLGLTGLPDALARVTMSTSFGHGDPARDEFLRVLRGSDDAELWPPGDSYAHKIISQVLGNSSPYWSNSKSFLATWVTLSADERRAAFEYIESLTDDFEYWFESPEVMRELLAGSCGWSKRPVRFHHEIKIDEVAAALALHGILLPGGFVNWVPMEGRSLKLSLFPSPPAGMLVDMRGPQAPTPAASRLFVQAQEAEKTASGLIRACLRHALELAAGCPEGSGWESWFHDLFTRCVGYHFWPEALRQDYEFLEAHLKYRVYESGQFRLLSREQLVGNFGRWVPFAPRHGADGLALEIINAVLAVYRPRRRRAGGVWELDMGGRVTVNTDRLSPVIGELERDLDTRILF